MPVFLSPCAHCGTRRSLRLAELRGFGVGIIELPYHELGRCCSVGGPYATVRAVRVAVFGEVRPSCEHLLGEIPVALGPGTPAVLQALEYELRLQKTHWDLVSQ